GSTGGGGPNGDGRGSAPDGTGAAKRAGGTEAQGTGAGPRAPGLRAVRRTVVRMEGLQGLAAELGCSRFHLRAVLGGRRRPGKELAGKLEARGIRVPRLRRAEERWV
ncbi:MAG: hypothetical protein IK066_00730, partial [Kiritimatiellae bacterium]|nr:hypothetical protein [Kiritimatiellia bacterium]